METIADCEHDWERIDDWEGDPDVIGGVNEILYWRCRICGEEVNDEPEDFQEDDDE